MANSFNYFYILYQFGMESKYGKYNHFYTGKEASHQWKPAVTKKEHFTTL